MRGLRDTRVVLVALAISGLFAGVNSEPELGLSLGLDHQFVGCPLLKSVGPCEGLFEYIPNTGYFQWHNVKDVTQQLHWMGGHLQCVVNGNIKAYFTATCVFNDRYCTKMTAGGKVFEMTAHDMYKETNGDEVLNFRPLSDRKSIENGGAPDPKDNKIPDRKKYVCQADEFPHGRSAGLNVINGVNYYIVEEDKVTEGLYYRMFTVDVPADVTGDIIVYPLVNGWRSRSTATKLVVHSDNGSAAGVIPWLSESGNTTFKMSLNHLDCMTAVPGPVRVNVLQVRLGRYHMNTTQSIAAGTNAAGMGAEFATYKYLFWTSSVGGAVPYDFGGVPVVFTQIFEWHGGAPPPHHEYTMQLGAVTKKDFQLLLRGREGETIPGSVYFYWIGIYTGTGGVGGNLFGMLSYRSTLVRGAGLSDGPMDREGQPTAAADAIGFYELTSTAANAPQMALHCQRSTNVHKFDVGLVLCGAVVPQPTQINGIVFSEAFKGDTRKPDFGTTVSCPDKTSDDTHGQCPLEDSYCSAIIVTEPSVDGIYYRRSKDVFIRTTVALQTRADHWAEFKSAAALVLKLTANDNKFSASVSYPPPDDTETIKQLAGHHLQCLKYSVGTNTKVDPISTGTTTDSPDWMTAHHT